MLSISNITPSPPLVINSVLADTVLHTSSQLPSGSRTGRSVLENLSTQVVLMVKVLSSLSAFTYI
jgi:hypothetical protein